MKKGKNSQSSNMVEEMEPIPTPDSALKDAIDAYKQGAKITNIKLGLDTLNGPKKPFGGR